MFDDTVLIRKISYRDCLKSTCPHFLLTINTCASAMWQHLQYNNNNNNYYYYLQLGCHPVAVVILHVHRIWNGY